jgi:hypothetical protein
MSDPEESERRRIERERDMELIVGVLIPVAIFFFVLLLFAHFLQ